MACSCSGGRFSEGTVAWLRRYAPDPAGRLGETGMRGPHDGDVRLDVIGKRSHLPYAHVHVEAEALGRCRNPPLSSMAQFHVEMQALLVEIYKLERDADRIMGPQLPL